MELTTVNIFSLVATSKQERKAFVQAHINNLKEGNADVLQSHIQAKNMAQMLKEMMDDTEYKDIILTEAQKHGKGSFDMHNAKVQVKEAGTTWTYNDSKVTELEAAVEKAKADLAARQKFLQTIPAAGVADPDTGELMFPAVKTSTTTVAITLS